MLRTKAIHFAKLTAIACAVYSPLIVTSLADTGHESARCRAVRQLCEAGDSVCPAVTKGLVDDGVVCIGINAPPDPSGFLVGAVSDQEYAGRCERALTACRDNDKACTKWRDAFNQHGSVCPGVNAPLTATRRGPISTSNATSYSGAGNAPLSSDSIKSRAVDALAQLQTECDAPHENKTFSSQVRCIRGGIPQLSQEFAATAISDDIQLYALTADNLVDEVGRKAISPTAARVELQKAFLEFRDRVNRQNAEASARQDAARLQAQEVATTAKAEQQRREDQRAAAEAVKKAEEREAQRRHDQAVALCVDTANERINANPQFRNDNPWLWFHNVKDYCAADEGWYRKLPEAPVRITFQ
jgi:hypothetical protein